MTIQNSILYLSLFLGIFISLRFLFIQIRLFPKALNAIKETENRIFLLIGLSSFFSLTALYAIAYAITTGGPGSLIWMGIFTLIAMGTHFYTATLNTYTKHNPIIPKITKIKAGLFALIGLAFAGFTQIQLFNMSLTSVDISGPLNLSILISIFTALYAFYIPEKKQMKILSLLTLTTIIVLLGLTITLWVTHQSIIFAMLKLIISDALSGKAATSGALIATILYGFIYACLTLQSGFNPPNLITTTSQNTPPRQAGLLSILEPFGFMVSAIICIASLLLFTGNFGSSSYFCTSPFRVGFEKSVIANLPPGWIRTEQLPKDHPTIHHHDGKFALECNATTPHTDSIFLPKMPISSSTGIRFGYFKIKGDMKVTILQENGAPMGEIVLNETYRPVIINGIQRIWLEGPHKTGTWESYILRFGDFSDLNIISNQVMLQFTPTSKDTHWFIDKIQPVERPDIPTLLKNSVTSLFPHYGEYLLYTLASLVTLLSVLTWIKQGEKALGNFTKNKRIILLYKLLFLTCMISAMIITQEIPIIALYCGILILLILNTISIFTTLKKNKDNTHE